MTTDKQIIGSPVVFRLDQDSGVPTYLQLVHQVEHALRLGYLKVGDQLPKVRDVVTALTIHPNTVLKAYKELEAKGLAAGRPGQGTFITAALAAPPPEAGRALRAPLEQWFRDAEEAGLSEEAVTALIAVVREDLKRERIG